MDFAQRQLLCTFSTLTEYEREIANVCSAYKIDGDIYVLQNQLDINEVFLTYNVRKESKFSRHSKTISVHRKKDFNVIYSINALNLMMCVETDDRFCREHIIDWAYYKNSLVVANNGNITVFPTSLLKIVRPIV